MTSLVNLTPHSVSIVTSGETIVLPPSGTVARCSSVSAPAGEHGGVPLYVTTFGDVVDLPPPGEGVIYIVSALVRSAVPSRRDVASPGDLVRDGAGAVVGCRGLVVNG